MDSFLTALLKAISIIIAVASGAIVIHAALGGTIS